MAIYRFFVGCGIGGEYSIGGILIAECWRGKSRLHATGVMASSFGSGYLVASLLNLWLGGFGWRWLFVIGVAPALLIAFIRAKLKEPAQFELMREYKQHLRAIAKVDLGAQEAEFLQCCLGMFLMTKIYSSSMLPWVFCVGFFASLAFALMFIYVPEIYETNIRATAYGFSVQSGRIVAALAALPEDNYSVFFGGSYAMAGATVSLFYLIGVVASLFVRKPKEDLLHGNIFANSERKENAPALT